MTTQQNTAPAITVVLDQRSEKIERLSSELHAATVGNAKLSSSNRKLAEERNELAMRLLHATERADSLHEHVMQLRAELLNGTAADAEKLLADRNAEQSKRFRLEDALYTALGHYEGADMLDEACRRIREHVTLRQQLGELRMEAARACCRRALESQDAAIELPAMEVAP